MYTTKYLQSDYWKCWIFTSFSNPFYCAGNGSIPMKTVIFYEMITSAPLYIHFPRDFKYQNDIPKILLSSVFLCKESI